ncbi:hypothetical protein DEDE109153_14760 [Deinococcus deserti]|uniref:Uncharacterized protein n=1 Tax=Deinococcus deserti (strain DSM 17065 / CIP 109153 / LMG 22923 / VCD115) TaxID=546414 RepID=C1D0B3_DEIDV|nr:hypothetical protein [Deinococcus deserti]ACO47382.1 Conserved hypothetical protein; putative membrane protein [Deinococcus deserti VCD115]
MKPELWRPLLGTLGLMIGFGLYGLIGKLAEPWQSVCIGALFVILGAVAYWYAQGERWIQVLGLLLAVYGVLRAFLLR